MTMRFQYVPGQEQASPGEPRWPRYGLLLQLAVLSSVACTFHHSKQALAPEAAGARPPAPDARFVSEEDSGLAIFGVFVLAEPDHYAVLLERMRRDHRCGRLLYPQLDFYTDHWLLIAFPISRVTSLCEPEGAAPSVVPPLVPTTPGNAPGDE